MAALGIGNRVVDARHLRSGQIVELVCHPTGDLLAVIVAWDREIFGKFAYRPNDLERVPGGWVINS
jgi:hypothetical protein